MARFDVPKWLGIVVKDEIMRICAMRHVGRLLAKVLRSSRRDTATPRGSKPSPAALAHGHAALRGRSSRQHVRGRFIRHVQAPHGDASQQCRCLARRHDVMKPPAAAPKKCRYPLQGPPQAYERQDGKRASMLCAALRGASAAAHQHGTTDACVQEAWTVRSRRRMRRALSGGRAPRRTSTALRFGALLSEESRLNMRNSTHDFSS